jgi:hypothetical protein
MKSLPVACMLVATFAGSGSSQDATLAPLLPDGFVTLEQVVHDHGNKLPTGGAREEARGARHFHRIA